MKRDGDLNTLTDGKLYRSSDMARLGCNDCEGCSACCKGMGNSVVLDPYDVWRLTKGLGVTFSEMVGKQVMLSVMDGLILPSLNMENQTGACPFLNGEGRCSIHAFRPGICRLFPLGRYYHDGGFSYVLMTGECKKENRSKIKIDKWLGEPNLKAYEKFILQWKEILEETRKLLGETTDLEAQKQISVSLLQKYYLAPCGSDFLTEFGGRE
ncbi:MAG: YkgJ family cysteine cluster protein [Lachnospiraceae bacterium]|nr:YkgJ family cysteine cluster protein [Lachnospiraceae bacterium]